MIFIFDTTQSNKEFDFESFKAEAIKGMYAGNWKPQVERVYIPARQQDRMMTA